MPLFVLNGGKGKMPAVGHRPHFAEAFALDAVARPARIQTQIRKAVLLGAALPRPCTRQAVEPEPRERRLPAAKGVDAAYRKALQAFERLFLPREVAVFRPDGEDARFRAVFKVMEIDVPARVAKAGDDAVFFRRLLFDF